MYNIIEKYMNMLKKEDVNNFDINKNIYLSNAELDFTYDFIKKNWKDIIKNPNMLDIDRYKSKFSPENFPKIKQLLKESIQKYGSYL